jgi:hypothetical protein
MIQVPAGARVVLAMQPVDFRNYVVHRIMRSPGLRKLSSYRYINQLRLADQALQSA